MNSLPLAVAALAASMISAPASAAPSNQPPMNDFDQAFYTCDNDGAFVVTYDSTEPSSATMTTSNNNTQYAMKRTQAASGFQFTGDTAKFWTDGKTVTVEGTAQHLRNCRLKAG